MAKNFADQILELAEEIEYPATKESSTQVSMAYEFDDGSVQTVYIEALPDEDDYGNTVVSIYSSAVKYNKVSWEDLAEALRASAHYHYGAWAIDTLADGEEYLMMVDTCTFETLDADAFQASVDYVAYYANEMAKKY